jgi:hypothetical protein
MSSRASWLASDSATSGESSASRREAAKATRLIGGMMRNYTTVDPVRLDSILGALVIWGWGVEGSRPRCANVYCANGGS